MNRVHVMQPFGVDIDLATGIMEEPDNHLIRRASSMHGHYQKEDALKALVARDDPLHYEVYEKAIPEEDGHILFCISITQPGTVGGEYFMTKGHYHTKVATAETYFCLRGRGYMLMKTRDGACVAEPMVRGRMVYVPPYWAHRTINAGSEPLVSFCNYPADAGHNYGDIETEGFPKRCFSENGEDVWK